MEGYTKSFELNIKNEKDPLKQLQGTRKAIQCKLKKLLKEEQGFKFVETMKVSFIKETSGDELTFKTAYFNGATSQ